MIDQALVKKVKGVVEDNFSDQKDFLSELVAQRSDNGETVEKDVAELVKKKLESFNYSSDLVGVDKERPNVVCRIGPTRARKSLTLFSHMDTGSINGRFKGDPLQTFIRGERMYGWGIWDMKASVSCYVYVAKVLSDMGLQLAGKLLLSFAVDGVSGLGSKLGVKYLLNRGYRSKAAILGSPGPSLGIGHRGGYRFKLTTKGEAAHTGGQLWQTKEKGKNAIESMAQAIEALKSVEVPFKSAKAFPGKMPVFTFPTMIEGGTAVNMVPDTCVAYGDVRLMPGNSHKQVRVRIIEQLDRVEDLNYVLEDVLYVPAVEIDTKEVIVRSMAEALEVSDVKDVAIEGIGPWNNGWVFIQKDIPAVIQLPLIGGISRWGLEWVNVSSMRKMTQAVTLAVIDFLGLKD